MQGTKKATTLTSLALYDNTVPVLILTPDNQLPLVPPSSLLVLGRYVPLWLWILPAIQKQLERTPLGISHAQKSAVGGKGLELLNLYTV